ncbi:MAG: hypothetical protein LBU84_18140 [Prevotella sp.]|jgi:DNA repair protein RadA/Sms|nr:hypothetical protein [Prevotella sp.]
MISYYFSGEETEAALQEKGFRFNIHGKMPRIYINKDINEAATIIREGHPNLVIIDSIQTLVGEKTYRPTYEVQAHISLMIKKLSKECGCAIIAIGQVNKDDHYSGPQAIAHNLDVVMEMKRGINEEIIVSTPRKNRFAPTGNRAVFRMTKSGLLQKDEIETGFRLRHTGDNAIGIANFVTEDINGYTVDEITITKDTESMYPKLKLDRGSNIRASFLVSVAKKYFDFEPEYIARAILTEDLNRSSDLACIIAMLSSFYRKVIPLDTVFIASIDANGVLVPLANMEQRTKRAFDQGYNRVIGPKPSGSQVATWDVAENIVDVWKSMGY